VGPHRDDFVFEINNLSLKTYGSQGQHKTFQVVLRFAEFFYLKEVMGVVPIFLLDDIFGELDTKRSVKISEYLKDLGQAFITVTDFTNLSFIKKDNDDMYINLSLGAVVNG
jgi:DNA replication and repair protein RecF